jgi:hypothetical protein
MYLHTYFWTNQKFPLFKSQILESNDRMNEAAHTDNVVKIEGAFVDSNEFLKRCHANFDRDNAPGATFHCRLKK